MPITARPVEHGGRGARDATRCGGREPRGVGGHDSSESSASRGNVGAAKEVRSWGWPAVQTWVARPDLDVDSDDQLESR